MSSGLPLGHSVHDALKSGIECNDAKEMTAGTMISRTATTFCLAAALALSGPVAASALEMLDNSNFNRLLRQGRNAEAGAIQDRMELRQYQRRQQQFREQDRQNMTGPTPPLKLRPFKRNCQVQVFGSSSWLRNCR